MQNQKINSIGLLAIFLVIAIPTVYGAVEPSIIINMESGQTEKPIQVKNSGGTIVFSVDTDGTIFPEPSTPSLGLTFGAEQIVLDHSVGFTSASSGIGASVEGVITEFTLPLTADLWRITAIDVRTGDVVPSGSRICAGIFDLASGNLSFPLSNGDVGTVQVVGDGRNVIDINPMAELVVDTVYRVDFPAMYLAEGGQTLFIAFDGCTVKAFQFSTSGSSTSNSIDIILPSEQTNLTELKVGSPLDMEVVLQGGQAEYYIVIYAEPLG